MIDFLQQNIEMLLLKTWQQMYLAGLAILVTMIIAIPLGVWVARKDKIKQFVLGVSSVMQTIPSLALLGFLLPFLGIGALPALVALSIYAWLPIMRNTVNGLLGVPENLIEAADGLGFTKWQKLRYVELPLAVPVMVGGIRTAMTMAIGIATIAAFIGAGGLGDFIYQGLSLNSTELILLGAIPAACLALIVDYIIAQVEKKRFLRSIFAPLLLMLLLVVAVFGAQQQMANYDDNSVVIGTKNFTEQFILGEIMAQLIEKNSDIKVKRQFNLGGTKMAHEALLKGSIDIYPEYTGTAYMVILKQHKIESAEQVYQAVKKAYKLRFNLLWLSPFGFDNSNALAMRKAFAEQQGITTMSELAAVADQYSIAVSPDYFDRPDGKLGLEQVYHIFFAKTVIMEPGLMYKAVANQQVQVIMAYATDGRIKAYDLVLLQDDKHLFPPYYAAPIIRQATAKRYPELVTILNLLQGKITNEVIRELNYQVDIEGKLPAQVAKDFIVKLLKS